MARRAIVPLRGTEEERVAAAASILAGELHSTTDQLRLFVQNQLLASVNHGEVANAAARLALSSSSSRGLWPGDTAFQADTGTLYQCVALDGSEEGDWLAIASPGSEADATVIVADASAKTDASIQAAIDAAAAAGIEVVFVPAGTWSISASLLVPSHIRLVGAQGLTILRRAASGLNNLLRNDTSDTGAYGSNIDISLEGLVFDGARDAYSTNVTLVGFVHCSHVRVERCSFIGVYGWHGLELSACQAVRVADCLFDDFERTGENEEQLQLDAPLTTGTWPWDTATTLYDDIPCRDVAIVDCVFRAGATGIGTHSGSAGMLHHDVRISRCVFEDHTHHGIQFKGWRDTVISECVFRDQETAIEVNPANSTHVDRLAIAGCHFYECDKTSDQSRAIALFSQSDGTATVRDASITDCKVYDVGRHGIGVDYCLGVTIANCHVESCGRVGIYIFRSSDCKVLANRIRNCGSLAGSTEKDITLGSGSSSSLTTNDTIVQANDCDDVYVRQYCSRAIITANIIKVGITVDGSATAIQRAHNFVAGSWVA